MSFPGRFPFRFGARDKTVEIEHQALLDRLQPLGEIDSTTELYAETRAEARALATGWTANRRLANGLIPAKMIDTLEDWETACKLRPSPSQSRRERRRLVEAKFRGFVGNSRGDLEDAARKAAGSHFVAFVTVTPPNTTTYQIDGLFTGDIFALQSEGVNLTRLFEAGELWTMTGDVENDGEYTIVSVTIDELDIGPVVNDLGSFLYTFTRTAPTIDAVAYMPGINPGPPGFEFSSSYAMACVHLAQLGLDTIGVQRLITNVRRALEDMKPAWMTIDVGIGSGAETDAIAGEAICSITII